ncbi:MAG: hypothetical protein ACI8ZB_000517 [Desulforhopalus sp.]|jgi:hypothetical protein
MKKFWHVTSALIMIGSLAAASHLVAAPDLFDFEDFAVYDSSNTIIGTDTYSTSDYLGIPENISLEFCSGVRTLCVADHQDGAFIMDDSDFDSTAPIPDPSAILFIGAGLAKLVWAGRRKHLTEQPEVFTQYDLYMQ